MDSTAWPGGGLWEGEKMNDTEPQVAEKMVELLRNHTPEERLIMGCSMYDFARQLVVNSLTQGRRRLPPGVLRRELFLRFYASEFDPDRRIDIMRRLSNPST